MRSCVRAQVVLWEIWVDDAVGDGYLYFFLGGEEFKSYYIIIRMYARLPRTMAASDVRDFAARLSLVSCRRRETRFTLFPNTDIPDQEMMIHEGDLMIVDVNMARLVIQGRVGKGPVHIRAST